MRDNIFAELYNKLLGFFRQAEEEESAKDVACNRLRVVLMQDRTNLTPQLLEKMRGELVELLSKYLEMDKEALELNLEQEGEQMALMLSIPVIRAKDEADCELRAEGTEKSETADPLNASNQAEEIEKALAKEEAKESHDTSDDSEQDEESQANEETSDNSEQSEKSSAEDKILGHSECNEESQAETDEKPAKKFPNKKICGECRECELSDDIECEKKQSKK